MRVANAHGYVGGSPQAIMKLVNNERRVYLSVHVDDVLLVGSERDLEWFRRKVASGLTIKVDGPHAQGSGDTMFCLEAYYTFA